ncbi:MAG: tetratricopeptide repeat protein [Rhizobiales bacterium]|nr:tetratricopeptide repeat protein [Hyphomicrobiales bacterium]
MFQKLLQPSVSTRTFALTGSTVILALGLGGCQLTSSDVTGSLGDKAETSRSADPRRDVDLTAERYRANPRDAEAALRYGKALRATGQKAQAVAVLEQATIANSDNKALLAGYGRALADNGNFQQAFDVLGRAHSPDNPDWRILSAQGAVLDQLGRFEEARQYYSSALRITPDEPAVLSNLALSYVLSKDLPMAEETLRRAHSRAGNDPRVRANLALVVGLRGNMAEAEKIARADLPPAEGAANVAQLNQMLSPKENARAQMDKLPIASSKRSD